MHLRASLQHGLTILAVDLTARPTRPSAIAVDRGYVKPLYGDMKPITKFVCLRSSYVRFFFFSL